MHRIGFYGPTYSGKTALIERLAFPGMPHKNSPPIQCEIPTETRVDDIVFVEYPEGVLPIKEDGCTCYVIMTTRNEALWKDYIDAANTFLQPGEYVTVSTCMDTAKGQDRATHAPMGTFKLSIYKQVQCISLFKRVTLSSEERIKRYANAIKSEAKGPAKKTKKVCDEDGWIKV